MKKHATPEKPFDYVNFMTTLVRTEMVPRYASESKRWLRSFDRDIETIEFRTRHEGEAFLTKTLPVLGKALDRALVTGNLLTPRQFKKKPGCKIPAFLQVIFLVVFEKDGRIRKDVNVNAVRDLRQICFLLYKREEQLDEKQYDKSITEFTQVDRELYPVFNRKMFTAKEGFILSSARDLLRDLFRDLGDIRNVCKPRHGPGAVASGEIIWEKMEFKRKFSALHQVLPYYEFFIPNAMELANQVKWYKSLIEDDSPTARIVCVPKDSRGPRVISMEPLEIQWAQQGVARVLVEHIEKHHLTRGHVNFQSQEVNRELALRGSIEGDETIVTLDMQQASDRISLWLVKLLFFDTPIWKYLQGTRSVATELPCGKIFPLRKFAPMGSALCFPIESLVHWALCVSTLNVCSKIGLKEACKAVYVFGDDIVIRGQNHQPLF
jgi:hypothetical protein